MAATEEKALPVARARTGVATHFALPHKVLLLSATMLFMRVAENFYVPILPLYVKLLDASILLFVAGLVVGIHRLGQAVAFPFIGGWCDRIGYRKPFIAGVVLTSIASALGGLAVGTADLTLYRVLAGVGYGTMNIAAMSAINNMTTSQNRGTAMSVFSAATLAGAAIGPIPGGFIVESMSSQLAGYRWAFYGGGILQMLVGIAAFFVIRDKHEPARPTAPSAKGMSLFSQAIKTRMWPLPLWASSCSG